VKQNMAVMYSK